MNADSNSNIAVLQHLAELLRPAAGPCSKQITWYACGPLDIGVDIVRRVLEDYLGYHCTMVMNVTDVDDKILDDIDALGCRRPDVLTRVSEYVPEIINYIGLDIHSCGKDLRFPHHDNVEAEAFYHCCKQSRTCCKQSLKNFVTIKDALGSYSARQLRLMFVMQQWNKPTIYGEQSRAEVMARDAQLDNFFHNVDAAVRGADVSTTEQRWLHDDFDLNRQISVAQTTVDNALRDNVDTPASVVAVLMNP